MTTKIALLCNGELDEKDLDTLNTHLFTLVFTPKHHMRESATNLFIKFDCVVFNLEDSQARLYLSQESKTMNAANVKVIYKAPIGVHLDVADVKEKLNCDYCIKYIPTKTTDSKAEYINKFLADHISKVTVSVLDQIKSYLLKKISCLRN